MSRSHAPRLTRASLSLLLALLSSLLTPVRADDAPAAASLDGASFLLAHSGVQGADPAPEHFGTETAAADFNGDGRTDLAVSAPDDSAAGDTSHGRGAVFVFFGRGDHFAGLELADREADCALYGTGPFSAFGTALAAGDFDGDGLDDLAVSESDLQRVHRGRVYVVSGRQIRQARSLEMAKGDYTALVDGRADGAEGGHWLWFGQETDAGDLNGDGIEDLAIGAWAGDGLAGERKQAGEVVVYLGRRDWPRQLIASPAGADLFVVGARGDAWFGYGVAVADLDGRGADELVVASREDAIEPAPRNSGVLSVLAFDGDPLSLPRNPGPAPLGMVWDLATAPPRTLVAGALVNGRIGTSYDQKGGRSLDAGDVDGDGYEDLLIGAPFAGASGPEGRPGGAVYLLYGGPAVAAARRLDLGASEHTTAVFLGPPDAQAGDAVRLADVNGDGREDALVGLPGWRDERGAVLIFAGRANRDLPPGGDAILTGEVSNWRAGEDVLAVDASFAGRPLVLAGLPRALRRTDGVARARAGEVCGLDASPLLSAVPRDPLIGLGETPTHVEPGTRRTVDVSVTGGSGATSLELFRAPEWARLEAKGDGGYRLSLEPRTADRGRHVVEIVARDAAGGVVRRAVELVAGYMPSVEHVRLAGKRNPKLTVVGGGISNPDAEVLLDGVPLDALKFPSKYLADGGATSTRVIATDPRLSIALGAGSPMTIRVRNPKEGLISEPVVLVP